jgi:hypothetical protein
MSDNPDRETQLHRVARSIYCSWTPGDPSVRQLAALSGLHYHYVWRRFSDPEQARRNTLEPWMREIGMAAPGIPAGASLHDRATGFARALAAYFASDQYRMMLYLVIRDANRFPWLPAGYRRAVVAPVRRAIEDLVRDYGRRANLYAALRKGAAEQFFTTLETQFALCALRPPAGDIDPFSEGIAEQAAARLVAAVELLDLSHAA